MFPVSVVLLLGVAAGLAAASTPVSLPLHRTERTSFHADASVQAPGMHAHRDLLRGAGVKVPMSGGVLNTGAFFINVSIGGGSSPQTFPALVDTGSSNIWVVGFDSKKSSSYVPLGCDADECTKCAVNTPAGCTGLPCLFGPPVCDSGACGFGISYGGGGSLNVGVLGNDHVCIQGTGLCTDKAPFGTVTRSVGALASMSSVSSPSADLLRRGAGAGLGGIIGMAFPRNACNPSCVTTMWDALVSEYPSQIGNGMFSMCLTSDKGGVMDLGFVNQTRLAGPVVELKVTQEHWYNLAVVDLSVGGVGTGLPSIAFSDVNDAIGSFVDSGTTLFLLGTAPFGALQNIFTSRFASLPGVNALWNGQCVAKSVIDPVKAKYPDIDVHIDVNGNFNAGKNADVKTFPLPASSYLLDTGSQYCLGVAHVSGIGAILGGVFLENYVSVMNPTHGAATVGLAPIKPGSCA